MTQWFFELYKIAEITRRTPTKNPMYTLLGPDGKLIARKFLRQDLMGIDPKKLTRELVTFVGYPEPEWVLGQQSFADAIKKFEAKKKAPVKTPAKTVAKPVKSPSIASKRPTRARKAPTR